MIRTEIRQGIVKKTLSLTFALSAAVLAYAQQAQQVAVSGTVTDAGGNPISYASVSFISKETNKLADATLADDKGHYSVSVRPGNYTVKIDAPGYADITTDRTITGAGTITAIKMTPLQGQAAIDSQTQNIQGVTITASSGKAYKVELDKKTYDVKSDLTTVGGNLQDVLGNVPSVAVDVDGTVSMRGSSNVKFLINGKPSSLLGIDDSADALKAIPADEIDRIEVITNPSAKFEASGTAGILNIILKKDRKMGFNGSVTGSLGNPDQANFSTNLNWRKGNWIWYVNGSTGYNESTGHSKNLTTRKDDLNSLAADAFPFIQISNQTADNKRTMRRYNLTAGLIHDFNEYTSVNFSAMARNFNRSGFSPNLYHEKEYSDPSNFLEKDRERDSRDGNNSWATQFDLGLDQKIGDNGQNLTVSGSFQTNKSDGTSYITQQSFVNNVLQTTGNSINNVDTDSKNKTFIGKADYELPIGDESKFEAGLRYDYNQNKYNYFVDESKDGSPIETRFDFTSKTVYAENILGAYAQFRSKIGDRFGYQVGLRSETSSIDIDFNNFEDDGTPKNDKVRKDYTKLFPSVFLSYNLDAQNQILVNYSRRINRPRAFWLIPFNSFNDDRNYFRGNPDLNPSYENSFEVGYSLSNRKITFNPTLYFRKSQDEMNRYQYVDDKGAINTIPFNVGHNTNYGLDMNGTYDPFKWWKLMLSANLYGYKNEGSFNLFPDDPKLNNDFSGKGFAYSLRLSNTFKPTKDLNFQIQSFYRAPQKTAMNNRKAMYGVDFGATQTILKGNGTIAFNVRDVFDTRKFKMSSSTAQFDRVSEMQWMPRQITLSFTYRFKKGEIFQSKKKSKDVNANYQEDDGGFGEGQGM